MESYCFYENGFVGTVFHFKYSKNEAGHNEKFRERTFQIQVPIALSQSLKALCTNWSSIQKIVYHMIL